LPFYSLLRKQNLLHSLVDGQPITLEIKDGPLTRFGPMLPLVRILFPALHIKYVSQFTQSPIYLDRRRWQNDPADIEHFVGYLKQVLPIKPANHGVILVRRGINRGYPGGLYALRSGADRRTIGVGFEKIIEQVTDKRPDTICVVLEDLAFAEQVSLFLNADTLIAQHGAAFVHAHWMPRGGRLVELQCRNFPLEPDFVPTIAKLRDHKLSVVFYPCKANNDRLIMTIGNATKISQLVGN
jgi:hypothetical protein